MKTLNRISGSEVRRWKTVTDALRPGKGFIVENHGAVEAVILHPSDLPGEEAGFDLKKHFERVKRLGPMPPARMVRSAEL